MEDGYNVYFTSVNIEWNYLFFNVELGAKSHTFRKEQLKMLFIMSFRLRVVPHFSSGIVERAKRERA